MRPVVTQCRAINISLSVCCLVLSAIAVNAEITWQEFQRQALPALEPEPLWTFTKELTAGVPPMPRDAGALPLRGDELEITTDWRIILESQASPSLSHAAHELKRYLGSAMGVELKIEAAADPAALAGENRIILATTRERLPQAAAGLKGSKDYRIKIGDKAVMICGYDEKGAAYGLYNLIMRFRLREAPFLPAKLDTRRHSLHQARMTLSGLGWMEWPDNYLATLPHHGFDSILCSIYRNPDNSPGVLPHWGDNTKRVHAPGEMKSLLQRAARYGISCYTPFLYHYTGTPENIEGLRAQARKVVTEFPEIRGYVLLTEGFMFNKWGFGNRSEEEFQMWLDNWPKAVGIVAEEMRAIKPDIEILPWEYNVPNAATWTNSKARIMEHLPKTCIPLLTFENGTSVEWDGEQGRLFDYAISRVGPAEVTQAQIKRAREIGLNTIYSKADCFASWQFGTFPYLPFPHQWHKRYKALVEWGVNGTLESWSYGFKPNWVAEMRAWYAWSDAPPLETLLRQIARREFGPGSEDDVLKAWELFSQAIQQYPDTVGYWCGCNAVAAPMFFAQPQRHPSLIHKQSYRHSWRLPEVEDAAPPHWPYNIRRHMLNPDFSNQSNAAKAYTRFFSVEVFTKYLNIAADLMEQGLRHYRKAALAAPATKRKGAFREVLLAEQLQRMMRSAHAILTFEEMRLELNTSKDRNRRMELLGKMEPILREERERAVAAYETARRDSRLGYEWEQDYIYTPAIIREKIKLIDDTLNFQIPEYREEQNLK